jgi:hypothetical protein
LRIWTRSRNLRTKAVTTGRSGTTWASRRSEVTAWTARAAGDLVINEHDEDDPPRTRSSFSCCAAPRCSSLTVTGSTRRLELSCSRLRHGGRDDHHRAGRHAGKGVRGLRLGTHHARLLRLQCQQRILYRRDLLPGSRDKRPELYHQAFSITVPPPSSKLSRTQTPDLPNMTPPRR